MLSRYYNKARQPDLNATCSKNTDSMYQVIKATEAGHSCR